MARIGYIDESACHIALTRDDMIELARAGEIVVPRSTHEALTRSGKAVNRADRGTRALVVVLDGSQSEMGAE